MYRNRNLNLEGIFGYNQLLVNGVDVAPSINSNTNDIGYIYNGALINTSAGTLNNAQITEAISSLTETNTQDIATIKTTLQETINKQKEDVVSINSNLNSQTTSCETYSYLNIELDMNPMLSRLLSSFALNLPKHFVKVPTKLMF